MLDKLKFVFHYHTRKRWHMQEKAKKFLDFRICPYFSTFSAVMRMHPLAY